MRVWTERFHTAAYTSLLMGAVFARAYNEPFYPENLDATTSSLKTKLRGELWDLMREASLDGYRRPTIYIEHDMREYMRQFPVYDLNDELGGQKKAFGLFIEWFIRSTLLEYNETTPIPALRDPSRPAVQLELDSLDAAFDRGEEIDRNIDRPSNAYMWWHEDGTWLSKLFDPTKFAGSSTEVETVVWAAMQAIHMFEFILTCISNLDGKCRFGRSTMRFDINNLEKTKDLVSTSLTPTNMWMRMSPPKTATVKVVLFGIFQAEEIVMQLDVKSPLLLRLFARSPPASVSSPSLSPSPSLYPDIVGRVNELLDIPLVLDALYNYSGIPNRNHGRNTPPPPLQIFTFLLKHHFNLQFDDGMFITPLDVPQDYWLFKRRATIFANGPELVSERSALDYTNGMEFLIPYLPPLFSYTDPANSGEMIEHYLGNPRTWEPDYEFFESRWVDDVE